jgi:hypothetical protein
MLLTFILKCVQMRKMPIKNYLVHVSIINDIYGGKKCSILKKLVQLVNYNINTWNWMHSNNKAMESDYFNHKL